MASDILLESGTNEVEILEFYLGQQSMGINVAKVAQIVAFDDVDLTRIPDENKAMLGTILWQDKSISLIDLKEVLKKNKTAHDENYRPIVLVTEFNGVVNGFLCDGVSRIHRIGWDDMDPLSGYLGKYSSMFTGSVNIEDRDVLIVDFEFIISELFPETRMVFVHDDSDSSKGLASRDSMKIVFAEDSPFIRSSIMELLENAGYKGVLAYENGESAYGYIKSVVEKAKESDSNISDFVNLVVSDIEMPQMDGLTLCRKIKQDLSLVDLPVIIFSSLINEQMVMKCKEVHADGYTTKPRSKELVELMDKHLGVA